MWLIFYIETAFVHEYDGRTQANTETEFQFCFSQAIEVAELHDRIHLRTTYYNYAKHLESTGNISAAIVK